MRSNRAALCSLRLPEERRSHLLGGIEMIVKVAGKLEGMARHLKHARKAKQTLPTALATNSGSTANSAEGLNLFGRT